MFIFRKQIENLKKLLLPGKVIVIYGARRVGKTTLLKNFKINEELGGLTWEDEIDIAPETLYAETTKTPLPEGCKRRKNKVQYNYRTKFNSDFSYWPIRYFPTCTYLTYYVSFSN